MSEAMESSIFENEAGLDPQQDLASSTPMDEASNASEGVEPSDETPAQLPVEISAAGGESPQEPDRIGEDDIPDEVARQKLAEELDRLIERVQAATPEYTPPPFSPRGLVALVEKNLSQFSPQLRLGVLERLRSGVAGDLFDLDTWKGIWYVVNYSLEHQRDLLQRRLSGEYETDEWGLDSEFLDAVLPFFQFMYKSYWRIEVNGLENIPEAGRALLVCNHSGQLPWDGTMLGTAVLTEHPSGRLVRTLYGTWFPTLPFVSAMLTKLGQALATEENGIRLLEQDELVAVFPEGYKGVGKLFKDRYRLARFGRGGFVRMALKTQAPMIPVSVVGAEETYISLTKVPAIARLINFPYFPISPTFPWFGLLGFIPLPSKWFIDIGEPIPTEEYEPGAANNLILISQLSDQMRNIVQKMIYARLAERKSVFFG